MDYSLKNLELSKNILKILYKKEIYNVFSLINFLPSRYEVYEVSDEKEELTNEEKTTVKAKILGEIDEIHLKNTHKITFHALISNKIMVEVNIFNRSYLLEKLKLTKDNDNNSFIIISGKFDSKYNSFNVNQIFFEDFKEKIIPVYKIDELYNYQIEKIMRKCIDYLSSNIYDELPQKYLNKYKLISIKDFYEYAHFPKNQKEINEVSRRLKYLELLKLELKYQYLRYNNRKIIKEPKNYDIERVKKFINKLPFELTIDQKNATNEIFSDLKSKYPMNRLLEGDVGSGKTICCILASLGVVSSNYQVAFMAPTEILAYQHYETFTKLLQSENIKVKLITSTTKKSEKEIIKKELKTGELHILIGTHSLLNDDLEFLNLGLVITDEQHRFGVNQRKLLKKKGKVVDSLFLSATPIPRSMALTFFGDLDLSIIKSMPLGRKSVITNLVNPKNLESMYILMEKEVLNNRACYVVAPKISDSDTENINNVIKLYEIIKERFLGIADVVLLHGKMKSKEKMEALNDFTSLRKPIIVSTTVVEVGIDVKEATIMVIFNAEMFGLSQLHQLRGRIGRSEKQGYCFLVTNKEKERLNIMTKSSDGFYLAECDLKLRGMGDLLGEKQSGRWDLKYADFKTDLKILECARNDAIEMINDKSLFSNISYRFLLKDLKSDESIQKLEHLD